MSKRHIEYGSILHYMQTLKEYLEIYMDFCRNAPPSASAHFPHCKWLQILSKVTSVHTYN